MIISRRGKGRREKGRKGLENGIALAPDQWNAISYNRVVSHLHVHVASSTTPGFVVTVDYIHVFISDLVLYLALLSCRHPGVDPR